MRTTSDGPQPAAERTLQGRSQLEYISLREENIEEIRFVEQY